MKKEIWVQIIWTFRSAVGSDRDPNDADQAPADEGLGGGCRQVRGSVPERRKRGRARSFLRHHAVRFLGLMGNLLRKVPTPGLQEGKRKDTRTTEKTGQWKDTAGKVLTLHIRERIDC